MRLRILEQGHRTRVRLFLAMVSRLSGVPASDVLKTLLYRPEIFGRHVLDLSAEVMRGPSFWTAGEREYLAVVTARANRSSFCVVTHDELVRLASDGALDPECPDGIRPELAAVVDYVEKVTRAPDTVSAEDAAAVLRAGVPREAVVEALHVNLVMNVVNRVAHAFAFELKPGQLQKGTRSLHRMKYRIPHVLTG